MIEELASGFQWERVRCHLFGVVTMGGHLDAIFDMSRRL